MEVLGAFLVSSWGRASSWTSAGDCGFGNTTGACLGYTFVESETAFGRVLPRESFEVSSKARIPRQAEVAWPTEDVV